MDGQLLEKLMNLKALLRSYEKLAVAFSGGVDSTLLLRLASETLGDNALGLTIDSPTMTTEDLDDVRAFYTQHHIAYELIPLSQLDNAAFRHNSAMRCYICKSMEFSAMAEVARAHGITTLAAGINADDLGDYRPGIKALEEIGVVQPLQEAGLTKANIRELAKHYGLKSWNKPAGSCLASRVPYGEQITGEKLHKVSAAEQFLRDLGLKNLRVRCHSGNFARIEVAPEERSHFFNSSFMDKVATAFTKMGFTYTALDLNGYRSGSMNEMLDAETKNKVKVTIHGSH
ncbi:MAG: ATP-dependent sacrificial sulfur transferase LarE [Sporolactobacillus sp.]